MLVFLGCHLSSDGCILKWKGGLERRGFAPCCFGCILCVLGLSRSENLFTDVRLLFTMRWDSCLAVAAKILPRKSFLWGDLNLTDGLCKKEITFLPNPPPVPLSLWEPTVLSHCCRQCMSLYEIHEVPRLSGAAWPWGLAAGVSKADPPVSTGHVAVAESMAGMPPHTQAVWMNRASLTREADVSACGFLHFWVSKWVLVGWFFLFIWALFSQSLELLQPHKWDDC